MVFRIAPERDSAYPVRPTAAVVVVGMAAILLTALYPVGAAEPGGLASAPQAPEALRRTTEAGTAGAAWRGVPPAGFLPAIQVNADPNNLVDSYEGVAAVAEDGAVYAAWTEVDGSTGVQSVLFSRSLDHGASFSVPVRVNDDTGTPYDAYGPRLALDSGGAIYVVWFDYRAYTDVTDPIDVYLDRSLDGGVTWSTDVLVSTDANGTYPWQFRPSIAVDQIAGTVYVAFTDAASWETRGYDVRFARSTDSGASFEVTIPVTDDVGTAEQSWPDVAVDPTTGAVHVVFQDLRSGTDRDVYLAGSSDSGQTFGANLVVNDVTTADQYEPAIDISEDGIIYVVWRDWRLDTDLLNPPEDNRIFAGRSDDGGATFGPSVPVSDTASEIASDGDIFPVAVVGDDGDLTVAWYDRRSGGSISYHDGCDDSALVFSVDGVISDQAGSFPSALPRLAAAGSGVVYAVFMDTRAGGDLWDLQAARSPLGGDSNGDGVFDARDVADAVILEYDPAYPVEGNPGCSVGGEEGIGCVLGVIYR